MSTELKIQVEGLRQEVARQEATINTLVMTLKETADDLSDGGYDIQAGAINNLLEEIK